jgi:predicted lipoprotein with Yx(FWY)xxD motif
MRAGIAATATSVLAALVACGGHVGAPPTRAAPAPPRAALDVAAVTITTHVVTGLGPVLSTPTGYTLYAFRPDARRIAHCVKGCTAFFMPVLVPRGVVVAAGGGARKALVGLTHDTLGRRVATYAHWPLYTFVGDERGKAKAQGATLPEPCAFLDIDCALNLGGTVWFALRPSGALVTRR